MGRSTFGRGDLNPAASQPALWNAVAISAAAVGSAGLFLLELLAGKILLPLFGGAPGVWVSCLAFFQVALVAATVYADRLIRLRQPRVQLASQAAVFAVAAIVAPLGMATAFAWARPESPLPLPLPLLVVAVLAAGVGPVFFAVATLSPIFGHWRSLWPDAATDRVGSGHAAYGLYAAGNAGSFAMLAAYPTLIEPLAGIERQVDFASRLFSVVAALMLVMGVITVWLAGQLRTTTHAPDTCTAVTSKQWLWWAGLAAVPASWLASVTTHVTVEVAPIPLLWVVPLAIYLASFVAVFTPAGRRLRRFEGPALVVASALALWMVASGVDNPATLALALHLVAFGVACLCIHGMLVDDRPPAERLSSFYLAMAVGGACGGLWNALGAPAVFDAHHEFPLAIAAAAGLAPALGRWRLPVRLSAVVFVAALVAGGLTPGLGLPRWGWVAVVAIAVVVPAAVLSGLERSAAFVATAICTFFVGEVSLQVVARERTFFGVLRVCDSPNGPSRILTHGGIRHGQQLVSDDPERRRIPLTYYAEAGPLGSVFRGLDALGRRGRVAVAGLGIGTVATYARPGDEYVFFEIDPAVARIAENTRWFSFLADCRGSTRVVVDDARRALEREPDGSLDFLIVDAFSGDSVPTHLLTREAFALYGRKLHPDGVLALHVSNNYLDFVPVVEALAADGGWMGIYARDANLGEGVARVPSEWMTLSRSLDSLKAVYAKPHPNNRWQWTPLAETPTSRPWTDDRTAIIEALWNRRAAKPYPAAPAAR